MATFPFAHNPHNRFDPKQSCKLHSNSNHIHTAYQPTRRVLIIRSDCWQQTLPPLHPHPLGKLESDKQPRTPAATRQADQLPTTTLIQLPAYLADAVLRATAAVPTSPDRDTEPLPRPPSPNTLAAIRQALAPHNLAAIAQTVQHGTPPQQHAQQASGSQSPLGSEGGSPSSPTNGAADLQHLDPKQRLIEQLLPQIPAEATEILYDAGYETLDAIRQLNVNLADPNNDLTSAEIYTKRTLKPGHKKLIFQVYFFTWSPPIAQTH